MDDDSVNHGSKGDLSTHSPEPKRLVTQLPSDDYIYDTVTTERDGEFTEREKTFDQKTKRSSLEWLIDLSQRFQKDHEKNMRKKRQLSQERAMEKRVNLPKISLKGATSQLKLDTNINSPYADIGAN